MQEKQLLPAIRDLFGRDPEVLASDLHPDFCRYFRHCLGQSESLSQYFDELQYFMRIGKLQGSVLDLAAGFGVSSICLRALGARQVTALDVVDTKVRTARRLFARMQVDVEAVLGSALELPFPDRTFDGVFIKDAVSHIADRKRLLREVRRVLRPNGTVVIYDDRNGRNVAVRKQTEAIWECSEFGSPSELEELGLAVNYCELRARFIRERFPALDDVTIDQLARETRGHTVVTLEQVVSARLAGNPDPLSPEAPCVHPGSGIAQEILLDPLELVRELDGLGLRARTWPPLRMDPVYWSTRGSWKGVLKRRVFGMIWPLPIGRVPEIIISARRDG